MTSKFDKLQYVSVCDSFDFSKLYSNILHSQLKTCMERPSSKASAQLFYTQSKTILVQILLSNEGLAGCSHQTHSLVQQHYVCTIEFMSNET